MKTLSDRLAERFAQEVATGDTADWRAGEAKRLAADLKQDLENNHQLWPQVEVHGDDIMIKNGDFSVSIVVFGPGRYLVGGNYGPTIWPPSETNEDGMLDAVSKLILGR